jgi:hypothetical protein
MASAFAMGSAACWMAGSWPGKLIGAGWLIYAEASMLPPSPMELKSVAICCA